MKITVAPAYCYRSMRCGFTSHIDGSSSVASGSALASLLTSPGLLPSHGNTMKGAFNQHTILEAGSLKRLVVKP